MGEHDSANVSDSTKIEILGEYNVYGINIDSTGVTGSFGDTELTLPLTRQTTLTFVV